MIKLLIVDDESIIRKGIRHYINWYKHGIEVVGEAANGKIGFESALSIQPDIIVSDIRMPIMDGLTMAQEIRKLLPHIKIILLTGYNDKEYLFSAIKINAFDFVMKSANPTNIVEAVLKAKEAILVENQTQTIYHKNTKLLESNYTVLRQELLYNLLTGNIDCSLPIEQANLLDVQFCGPQYMLVYVDIPKNIEATEFIQIAMYILKKHHPFFAVVQENEIWGILNVPETCDSRAIFKLLIDSNMTTPHLKLLYTHPLNSLEEISKIYKKMLMQSKRLFWQPDSSLTLLKEHFKVTTLPLDILLRLEDELIDGFQQQNSVIFLERVEQFYNTAKLYQLPFLVLKESIKRMTAAMYRSIDKYEEAGKLLEKMDSLYIVNDIFALFKTIITIHETNTPSNPIIKKAVAYIEQNYNNQITLNKIASICYVSPAYLSKIFKEEVGIGIIEYLREIRIKKAKQLLKKTNMKIQDIANKVGYNDYKHFSVCFSQETGTSPRKFRQS